MATEPKVGGFDPNEGGRPMLPSVEGLLGHMGAPPEELLSKVTGVDAYMHCFAAMEQDVLAKASIAPPPTAFSFGRISYMPEAYNSGVLQWPGIAPEALRKVVRENVAPQMIIGMRQDDVIRYSQLSSQPWQPGWRIETLTGEEHPTAADRAAMREAEQFIMNSAIELANGDARKRDARRLTNFQKFLTALVRDTLTFDMIAVWTDTANDGKVKGYALLPAGNIRLVGPSGYLGDKSIFAVAIDDGARVIHQFTREELTIYVRNVRNDPDVLGYGLSEIEVAIRLIKGFQDAVDFNLSTFDRSSVPHGIFVMSGGQVTQRQLDLLNRMFTNLKKGITKAWALPIIGLSEGSKLELIDFSTLKGNEGVYKELMNMLMGAFATVYRFPVRRLGYRISGHGKDTEPLPDSSMKLVDDDDPGLAPLLVHIENIINEYLLWSRWPTLRFVFSGKSPKEDARRFEFRKNAMTWGEARAAAGLDKLEKVIEGIGLELKPMKILAHVMSMSPIDPNLSGIFQSVVQPYLQKIFGVEKDAAQPGNRMTSSIDPASSEAHGKLSGVRRDSASE